MVGAKPVKPWLVLTAVLFGFFMAVLDMPQSGERIRGRDHMKAMQEAYPGPPTITVRRVVGSGDVWVVEGRSDYGGRIYHIANILEFREGKIIRETRYYADPFEAPAWRAQWVEPIEAEHPAEY